MVRITFIGTYYGFQVLLKKRNSLIVSVLGFYRFLMMFTN